MTWNFEKTIDAEQEILKALSNVVGAAKSKKKASPRKNKKNNNDQAEDRNKKENERLKGRIETLEAIIATAPDIIRNFSNTLPIQAKPVIIEKEDDKEKSVKLSYRLNDNFFSYDIGISCRDNETAGSSEVAVTIKDEIDRAIGRYAVQIKHDKKSGQYEASIIYERHERAQTTIYTEKEVIYRELERHEYSRIFKSYAETFFERRQDFTSRADKSLTILPESLMGGVLGFTYLGENFMARRADLFGDMAFMVDLHEAIHTPDEYETRRLTDWMLAKKPDPYKR